ncbi:hypothetical protein [Oricola sp. NBU1457]|uniref:aspartate racemase/maleate isomerase family protein n=1 Tax=Oricola nitratireducens TaxID=2775868 RepID=UPI001865DC63
MVFSCAGINLSNGIDAIEKEKGLPVISSNGALLWEALRLTGIRQPVDGFSMLLKGIDRQGTPLR